MKMSRAPRPIQTSTPVVPRPGRRARRASAAKPRIVVIRPRRPVARKRPTGSVAPSRTAAIGGTRVARSAGRRLATTVTMIPTSERDDHRARLEHEPVVRQREADRVEQLEEPVRERRGRRARRRSRRARPMTRASTITELSTCRREAPIVRSVANSRMRCAIVIESELEITNAPTKSAMPPNASRKSCRKEMKLVAPSASFFACAVGGPHLRAGREDLPDLLRELLRRHARCSPRPDLVELADLVEEPLRGRQVEARERRAAQARGAAEVDEPGDVHPLARARRAWTPIDWPTFRSFFDAVAVDRRPGRSAATCRRRA